MKDPRLVAFGQRVRDLRKEKGLSQEAFADLTGIDRSYMGHIERGEKMSHSQKFIRLRMR